MKYKDNWSETKEHFKSWWRGKYFGRPLMWVTVKRENPLEEIEDTGVVPESLKERCLDVERKIKEKRNSCKSHIFMADAFPYIDLNIGPGSMAAYLGAEPMFTHHTIWYKECIENLEDLGDLKFDGESYWWKTHLDLIYKANVLSRGEFLIAIPDIMENLDILSAMRSPQNLCYDLMDRPELVKKYIKQIDGLYFKYYDMIYNIVKDEEGSCFTAFSVWGPGKTAKIQCDFSAMISPAQFREFVVPSIKDQVDAIDNSIYHLDGPEAIKHLDALMEIENLDALQWTAGAGQPDGGNEKWYPIYDKVRKANKSVWIMIYGGEFSDWIQRADKLVKRYGSAGIYLIFPTMKEEQALQLIEHSEKNWNI